MTKIVKLRTRRSGDRFQCHDLGLAVSSIKALKFFTNLQVFEKASKKQLKSLNGVRQIGPVLMDVFYL